jgi:predicted nucleotidyltransferase
MRLNQRIIDKLKLAVQNSFGNVNVYLFGSRVDDSKKGGDIDIAIDTNLSRLEFRKKKVQLISNLMRNDFELKMDVVNYNTQDKLLHDAIRNNAYRIL